MPITIANSNQQALTRTQQLRYAVVLALCEPPAMEYERLRHISSRDWRDLLRWLDTSGLALYFLDRLKDLNRLDLLPGAVLSRLNTNLEDNSRRLEEMIAESASIQREFQEAGLKYAVLKGFSLWPLSVPKLELRSQLDLDFLVAEESSGEARRIIEDMGYRLNAVSGRSWEFQTSEHRPASLANLYKSGMHRSVDLHIEDPSECRTSRLSRAQTQCFLGVRMPMLSPIDHFIGQGLHVYQHVCCEFMRAAHLLEFYRHILARQRDNRFWTQVRHQIANDPDTCDRLGMVLLLISRVMGPFAPEALTSWTVDQLPATASLWADRYAHRTALASFPGSKLYLLLQQEMKPIGLAAKRPSWKALLPQRLPSPITQPVPGESWLFRMKRYRIEIRFVLFRLRFHLVEGIRFLIESMLWRQSRKGLCL